MQTAQAKSKYAIETAELSKQYRSFWALKDCNIAIPQGAISALVGPNGAGKTTLLKLLASLNRPSAGTATVLGQTPSQTTAYLSKVGYLAQEVPLYAQFTAADHFAIGAHTEAHWDNTLATRRLKELDIPLERPIEKLSGGQRAQIGLAMALAKKPRLLLLDEPVAALDPLARTEFLASLTQAVADAGGQLTVLMSSHMLADLERICDHIVILAAGETQLCGTIEHTLKTHKLLAGPPDRPLPGSGYTVIKQMTSSTTTHALIRLEGVKSVVAAGWHARDVDIEEIVLAYMEQSRAAKKGDAQ